MSGVIEYVTQIDREWGKNISREECLHFIFSALLFSDVWFSVIKLEPGQDLSERFLLEKQHEAGNVY